MQDSESNPISLGSHYAFHRASAVLSQNRGREIGKVFAEYKDKLSHSRWRNKKRTRILNP